MSRRDVDIENIAIIGTGAVGGYYGALLQQSGARVHFLVHRDYAYVKQHGLRVHSPRGMIRLPNVHAYHHPDDMPACDLVIVALKTTANEILRQILPKVLALDGVVLTLQNGLGPDDEIARIVGPDRVLGGLCFLCANKVAHGTIEHVDYGLITLGEYRADGHAGGITNRLETVGALLDHAGIEMQLIPDLLAARWRKLVWNIPFNGLSVVFDCLTDVLMKNSETRMLSRRLMEEVAAASAVCAHPIEDAFLEKMMQHTDRMQPYAPSMKLDYDAGRPMELESIYGNAIRAAKEAGVDMSETANLYRTLQEMERQKRAE
jgi:2-dehydropantoate 2-reductase